jgi:hypothetical protein
MNSALECSEHQIRRAFYKRLGNDPSTAENVMADSYRCARGRASRNWAKLPALRYCAAIARKTCEVQFNSSCAE